MFERFSNSFLNDFNLDMLLGKFKSIRFRFFRKGEFIYMENEEAAAVYLVLSGEISIGSFSDDSDVRAISCSRSGDVIGFDDALSGSRYTRSAFAASDVNAVEISRSEFLDLTRRNDEFNLWMLKYLSRKIDMLAS